MTFGMNGPGFRPMIQEAQGMKNNGGGGNLGYFQRGKKKKDDDEIDVFSSESEDSFLLEDEALAEKDKENSGGFLKGILKKLGL